MLDIARTLALFLICTIILTGCNRSIRNLEEGNEYSIKQGDNSILCVYDNEKFIVRGALISVKNEYVEYEVSIENKTNAPITLMLPGSFEPFLQVKYHDQQIYRPITDFASDIRTYERTLQIGENFKQHFRSVNSLYKDNANTNCTYRIHIDTRFIHIAEEM